jgi:cytoskeletal protein CcmA (bactofilin family)
MPQDRSPNSQADTSTIGEDLTITGDVISKGGLRIDGRVHGDVECLSLILGENSEIEGNVVADEVMIRGRLIGSVRGRRVASDRSR